MNREFLKEQGLTDEQIEAVMKEHGKTVNDTKAKADKADTLESQIDDYKEQLKDRDNQLKELKKVDPAKLQERIDELKVENETKDNEYQEKLNKQAKDFSIESALRDAKARNPRIAKNALDLESISIKDGKLIGLDEQLTAIKESDSYLFKTDQDDLPGGLKGRKAHESKSGEGMSAITKEQFDKMNYGERVELYNKDIETYKKLNN